MNKNIQLIFLIIFVLNVASYAQDSTAAKTNTVPLVNGYYQTIDLNPNTDCKCAEKTQRTLDLAKGLRPNDVIDYTLHAYTFSFGNSSVAASKLFKAFENDLTIYKISMKEWSSFMLMTSSDFDAASFEKAAKQVFATFAPMTPEDFLKIKNTTSYYEYIQALEEVKLRKQQQASQTKN